jgi:hypothetical protein
VKQEFPHASQSFRDSNPHIFAQGTLGQVLLEPEEDLTKWEARSEKELQDQIAGFLERNNTVVIRSRTDKKTTTALGTPDLLFALKGCAVAYEIKLPGKKATKVQKEMMARMVANGWLCFVIDDYDKAVETTNKLFLQLTLDTAKS